MLDGNEDENKGTETPSGSSPEEQTDSNAAGANEHEEGFDDAGGDTTRAGKKKGSRKSEGDDDDEQIMIPKHRFDEVVEKLRASESKTEALTAKFENMAAALQGKSQQDRDNIVDQLSQKYAVKPEFIEDVLRAAEARAAKKYQGELAPVKKAQAEQAFQNELATLAEEIPEAADMSKEDREAIRKMAFDPKYSRTPITDIYKIMMFGKPKGKKKPAEVGRGGAGRPGSDELDISNMSLKEFEEYSNKLAQQS